jgi:hypothetical protein
MTTFDEREAFEHGFEHERTTVQGARAGHKMLGLWACLWAKPVLPPKLCESV